MLRARVPGKVLPVDVEIIAFDMFGTLVDWYTSIAAALAEVGGRAGIDADWAVLASAWRARYRPTLARVVAGELPFESLDTLHRMMLDELAADGGCRAARVEPPVRRSSASEHGGVVTEAADELGRDHDVARGQLVDRGMPQAEQHRIDPAAQDVQHVLDARLAVGRQAPQIGAPDHDGPGAQGQGLDDVAAAADTAVEHDLDAVADGLAHGRQRADARGRPVQVVAAEDAPVTPHPGRSDGEVLAVPYPGVGRPDGVARQVAVSQ